MRIDASHPLFEKLDNLWKKNGGKRVVYNGQSYLRIQDNDKYVYVLETDTSPEEQYQKTSI